MNLKVRLAHIQLNTLLLNEKIYPQPPEKKKKRHPCWCHILTVTNTRCYPLTLQPSRKPFDSLS